MNMKTATNPTEHTPGPWREVDGFIVGGPWADGEFHDICDPRCAPPDDDNAAMINANAQLITAAPNLLRGLQDLLEDHKRMFAESHPHSTIKWEECVEVQQALAAINKATNQKGT